MSVHLGLAFAAMGKLMSAQELTATFRQMDKDGGGTVSFAEFKQWMFNENNQTDLTATDELDSMSIDEAAAECRKAGLAVSGSVSLEAMKLALKTHNQKRTVREAFDDIDTDNSGFLDKQEIEMAFAMMGKLMSVQELDETFRQMDKDGEDGVSFPECWAGCKNLRNIFVAIHFFCVELNII